MRLASPGHAAFALTMIALGIMGLVKGDFAPLWLPVPSGVPAREALVYLSALISFGSGLGLLWRRTAPAASRLLFTWLLAWLLLLRVPHMFLATGVDTWWAAAQAAVMVAAAWVLYGWFAGDADRQRFGFATGPKGLRIARILYGVALIPFGLAHFMYLDATTVLVPGWLPWHTAWAYLTGGAFIAAGVAVLVGVRAKLAATLAAVQVGLFTLLVWVPIVAKGPTAFQWHEFVVSSALTAGAWVVAESYGDTPLP